MNFTLRRQNRSIHGYLLAALVAIEVLMSFSFLGYLHVEPISITFSYIPVLLAGALLGPLDSMILGTVFGLASMWKASASYVMPMDQLFSPFLSGHPAESILLSVGARALFGLLVGLLYLAVRLLPHPGLGVALVSFLGRSLHSLLVYTALWFWFPETGYTPRNTLLPFQDAGGFMTDLVTALIVLLFWRLFRSNFWRQFQHRVEIARSFQLQERYHRLSLLGIILLTLCSSVAVAFYFVHRMNSVLNQKGVSLSQTVYGDLLHLQIQFLIGILSMMVLVAIFLIFNRRYATYKEQEAKTDALTGVMTRRTFMQMCAKAMRTLRKSGQPFGYFIMVDLDRFKEINDRYGHPEGDRALREAVHLLREVFGQNSLVGRMGGDEFAVLLCTPTPRTELESALRHFQERLHRIHWDDWRMSCSIGVLPVPEVRPAEELYQEADQLLYTAKEQGRDRYIIGPYPEDLQVGAERA